MESDMKRILTVIHMVGGDQMGSEKSRNTKWSISVVNVKGDAKGESETKGNIEYPHPR